MQHSTKNSQTVTLAVDAYIDNTSLTELLITTNHVVDTCCLRLHKDIAAISEIVSNEKYINV